MALQTKTTKNPNAATVRHTRVDDALWNAAAEKAMTESGTGPSEMVRALLRAYVAGRVEL